jgi:hypothetical protein
VLAVGADTIFGFYSADGGTTWVEVGSWPLILEERLGAVGWYAESGFQPVDARAAIRLFGVIDVIPSLLFGD